MKRTRQAKWDKQHMKTLSTRMVRAEAEYIRRQCEAMNTTIYEVLQQLIRAWSDEHLWQEYVAERMAEGAAEDVEKAALWMQYVMERMTAGDAEGDAPAPQTDTNSCSIDTHDAAPSE